MLYIRILNRIMKKQILKYAGKAIKNTVMSSPNKERSKHADSIIRNHMIWSMGMSVVIPLPVADVLAVSAVQLDMIRQLCKVYEKDFSDTSGKAIVTALTSSTLAKAGARSVIKLIPGIGTIIGGVAVSILNGASTYALGEVFKKHFELGGTILDFDTERLKKAYKEKFEKGKKVAEQLRKEEDDKKEPGPAQPAKEPAAAGVRQEASQDEIVSRLKELSDLKNQGIITDEEFLQMKQRLIEKFGV